MPFDPTPICEFAVLGVPQPAGSKRAFAPRHPKTAEPYRTGDGRIVINVIDANPKSKEWKKRVADAARAAMGTVPPAGGPIRLRLAFTLKRPQSHFTRTGVLSKKGRDTIAHVTRPDVLKLARAVEDALTSICYGDDAQIVSELITKNYGEAQGVHVRVGHAVLTE